MLDGNTNIQLWRLYSWHYVVGIKFKWNMKK